MRNALEYMLGDIFAPPKRKDPNAATRGRCKRLAKKLGYRITIERYDDGNGYWIEDTDWPDETFCNSWDEVEEKLLAEFSRRKAAA